MRKILIVLLSIFLMFCNVLFLTSCKKSEITIEFIGDVVRSRFNYIAGVPEYSLYPISFEDYEKGDDEYHSRSFCHAKLTLTFNNTPKEYTAEDLYHIDKIIVDNVEHICRSRAGERRIKLKL